MNAKEKAEFLKLVAEKGYDAAGKAFGVSKWLSQRIAKDNGVRSPNKTIRKFKGI